MDVTGIHNGKVCVSVYVCVSGLITFEFPPGQIFGLKLGQSGSVGGG